jgi:hypothetical protein
MYTEESVMQDKLQQRHLWDSDVSRVEYGEKKQTSVWKSGWSWQENRRIS